MARVLVAGENGDVITALAEAAHRLLGPSSEFFTVEVSGDSVDTDLGWGTAVPVVRTLPQPQCRSTSSEPCAEVPGPVQQSLATTTKLALSDDGTSAKAILDAARFFEVDLIVAARRHQGWLSRLFLGSATDDLLRVTDTPVLVVNLE